MKQKANLMSFKNKLKDRCDALVKNSLELAESKQKPLHQQMHDLVVVKRKATDCTDFVSKIFSDEYISEFFRLEKQMVAQIKAVEKEFQSLDLMPIEEPEIHIFLKTRHDGRNQGCRKCKRWEHSICWISIRREVLHHKMKLSHFLLPYRLLSTKVEQIQSIDSRQIFNHCVTGPSAQLELQSAAVDLQSYSAPSLNVVATVSMCTPTASTSLEALMPFM